MRTYTRRYFQGRPLKAALVHVLRIAQKPMFSSDIAKALNMRVGEVRAYALAAIKAGHVRQVRKGVYEAVDEHQ